MENQNVIEEITVGTVIVAFQEPSLEELEAGDAWIIIRDDSLTE